MEQIIIYEIFLDNLEEQTKHLTTQSNKELAKMYSNAKEIYVNAVNHERRLYNGATAMLARTRILLKAIEHEIVERFIAEKSGYDI